MRNEKARSIWDHFVNCLRDERGSAMTEYLVVTVAVLPVAIFLFHPDNGMYHSAHSEYVRATTLLMFPGP